MASQKSTYESLILKLEDWVKASTEQDVISLMQMLETGKAYLRAASDLGNDEITLLEDFLLRDLRAFSHTVNQNAEQSLWVQSIKNRFMALLAQMSDQNRLQLFELDIEVAHHGEYSAGELVAMGELVCTQCGHRHQVDFVEQIQPCIECGNKTFGHLFTQQANESS